MTADDPAHRCGGKSALERRRTKGVHMRAGSECPGLCVRSRSPNPAGPASAYALCLVPAFPRAAARWVRLGRDACRPLPLFSCADRQRLGCSAPGSGDDRGSHGALGRRRGRRRSACDLAATAVAAGAAVVAADREVGAAAGSGARVGVCRCAAGRSAPGEAPRRAVGAVRDAPHVVRAPPRAHRTPAPRTVGHASRDAAFRRRQRVLAGPARGRGSGKRRARRASCRACCPPRRSRSRRAPPRKTAAPTAAAIASSTPPRARCGRLRSRPARPPGPRAARPPHRGGGSDFQLGVTTLPLPRAGPTARTTLVAPPMALPPGARACVADQGALSRPLPRARPALQPADPAARGQERCWSG